MQHFLEQQASAVAILLLLGPRLLDNEPYHMDGSASSGLYNPAVF